MSAEARSRSEVNAAPFLVIYLLYSLLFGILLYDLGQHPAVWSGMTFLLCGLGVVGLRKIKEKDVPLIMGILYLIGVSIGFYYYTQEVASDLILALVLSSLFLLGILGNVLYFLCEKQKLDYLNGQISESGLTLRRFERWFPLWLILIGNVLLVGLVTPLLWGAWYKVAGAKLFKVTGQANLNVWFAYLIENVNQSLLGVASLLGITLPKKAVEPTGAGKALVALFRVGILSLGLGALKRYLDLKKTTRRLMLAMGRAGWEQEKWESEVEGIRTESDTGESHESRRQMWQLRMRQLIQLFPSQQSAVLNEIIGKGDFQLRLQGKLKKQDLKIPEGHTPAFQPKHLSDWMRSELTDALADPSLYADAPGLRYEVIRELTNSLSEKNIQDIPARVRIKLALTLTRLRRVNDPKSIIQRVEDTLLRLERSSKEQHAEQEDAWMRFNEKRARFAALYALVRLGRSEHLVHLIPALRRSASALQVDALRYIALLSEIETASRVGVLKSVERLLLGREEDLPAPILEELRLALDELQEAEEDPYRAFAARALGYFLIPIEDEELLRDGTDVLIGCGHSYAIKAIWRLVRIRPDAETRQALFAELIEHGLEHVTGQFLRIKLVAGEADTELLAATLLGELPATPISRKALREAVIDIENTEDTRWRSMCSLGRLAQEGDRAFLEKLKYSSSRPRLWAANQYALYKCGSVDSLEDLIEQLATLESTAPIYRAVEEVLLDEDAVQAEAICTALSPEASNDERLESCETLVGLRVPSALVILSRLLQDTSAPKKIRQTVAEDLGILGRSLHTRDLGLLAASRRPAEWAAGPLLFALENDSDRLVRIRTARALGRLGLPEISERFKQSLLNPDENALVRQVVAQAVGEMGDTTWLDFLNQQYPIEKSAQVRQGMITALDRLGADAKFFLEQLQDKNSKIKQFSLKALAHRELTHEQKTYVAHLLADKHKDVRAATCDTLGAQNYHDAIEDICTLTNHEQEAEKNVRRAALQALRQLVYTDTDKYTVWPYLEFVWNNDPDHLVIRDCAAAMAKLYKTQAAPLLLQGLTAKKKRQPWTKSYAGIVWALGETRAPEADAILFEQLKKQLRSDEYNFNRLIALIRPGGLAGGVDALPYLIELVESNEQAYSWVAAQVIAEIGHFAAIEPLEEILEDKREDETIEPNTEAAILIALVRLGVWEYLEELVELLHDTSEEQEVARRRALGMLPDINMGLSPMLLMQAMNPRSTPHEKMRETAVKSLGKLAGELEQSLQVLQWQAQADPRAKIREAAQSGLDSIGGKLQRTLRKLRTGRTFETHAKVAHNEAPLHPAWGEPVVKEEQPEVVLLRPQTPATTKPVAEPVIEEPIIEEQPKPIEEFMGAILSDDRKQFEAKWQEHKADAPLPALWNHVLQTLQDIDTFKASWDQSWVLVPGTPNGKAAHWPFMMSKNVVTRREFAEFCEATQHPLPPGWHVERQGKATQAPVTQVSWYDATAYARWKGQELPSYNQLAMASKLQVHNLEGGQNYLESETFTPSEIQYEWTQSTHTRRKGLIQTFSPIHTRTQHCQKQDQNNELGFRCVVPIHCAKEPIVQVFLADIHSSLIRIFAHCAQGLGIDLPFERSEWENALQTFVDELNQAVGDLSEEERLALKQQEAEERKEAERKRLEEAERRRKEEAERKRLEEAERRRIAEEKRLAQQVELFWNSIRDGNWSQALRILQTEDKKLEASLRKLEQPLRALCTWITQNEDMIWLSEDQALEGRYAGRAVLIKDRFINRKEYHTFCMEQALPLPKNWKVNAKEISEPKSSALGLSLFSAKRFASIQGAQLPSVDQLETLTQADVSELSYEWTSTARHKTRGLYYAYTSSMDSIFSPQTHPTKRSHQLHETPMDVGFRLCYDIEEEQLPQLLQSVLTVLPKASRVSELPHQMGQTIMDTLQRM